MPSVISAAERWDRDLGVGTYEITRGEALLTVLGYSLNDTIVIFDRVRENSSCAEAARSSNS